MTTTPPLMTRLPTVQVHPPQDGEGPWLVQEGERYFRVGADAARLLDHLDGTRAIAAIAVDLGAPWTEERVRATAQSFSRLGLLADPDGAHGMSDAGKTGRRREATASGKRGRLRFVPPMTVQLTLWNPGRMLARLRPLTRAVLSRPGLTVLVLLLISGLLALAVQAQAVWQAVSTPARPLTYLAVIVGVVLVTAVHEMGHGAVLTHFGQRPTRIGVMLYYLSPAFFCDVTNAWRLPRKEQRVAVALAGVGVHSAVGAAAALAAVAAGGELRQGLLIFSVVCNLYGVLNLLPLVKFDGYLALMSHLDIPNLRAKAMADARTATLIRLTGGRRPRQLPHKRWAVAYGLACQLFPLYLVGTGLLIMGGVFSGMGTIGALLLLMLLGMLATQGYKLVVRNVREVRAAGGSLLRLAGLAAAGVAAVAVLLTQVTVELQASAGYARVDGRPVLVLPPGTHSASIPIGATVVLRSQGFLAGRTLGRTTVAPGAPRRARVSLTAISPLHTGIRVPATVRPLNGDPVLPVDAGSARVNLGRSSLALRLYHEYLASALNLPS